MPTWADVVALRTRQGRGGATGREELAARPTTPTCAGRLSLEIDSSPWHDGPLAHELDADRQAELEAAGERVLRTSREQAIRAPRQLVERLAAAGAPRRGQNRQKGVLH